jgi:hypothetical protein
MNAATGGIVSAREEHVRANGRAGAARRDARRTEPRADGAPGSGASGPVVTPDEVTIVAAKQLTIRCGESSITLTAAGKIIIRGKYIVSRSSGVQRIKGGSVQIN